MEKRQTLQRRREILDIVVENDGSSVDNLAKHFATSEVTIRKDLAELENTGLIIRRHGGAVPVPKEVLVDHQETVSAEKLAIASAAARLIKDHHRIVIDSGRTTAALLPMLASFDGLVVMTNSLTVAQRLRELEREPTILMTGGTWDRHSESFQGHLAEKILREYDFDQLFIGADGLDPARGTTTYNELTGLSKTMADVAREVIVLAESHKLVRKIPNLELMWQQVSVLVTDSGIGLDAKQQIEAHSVRIIN